MYPPTWASISTLLLSLSITTATALIPPTRPRQVAQRGQHDASQHGSLDSEQHGWLDDRREGKPGKGGKDCPPFSGNFTINQYQIYPENLDFDFRTCQLILGDLWNASVGIYDPYTKKFSALEFPGITHESQYHIGGVGVDERTGLLSIVVDAGDAFNTGGVDISGTNWIMQYDFTSQSLLYKINLTETTKGKYGGFQDVEQDPDGKVYVVGTYPSSILRVGKDGGDGKDKGKSGYKVEEWYVPYPNNATTTLAGLGGLATKEWILLSNDATAGVVYRFDMRADKGKPELVPLTPDTKIGSSDSIYLPPKYDGTVALVAVDLEGIVVLRSKNGEWKAAEYLGIVPWDGSTGTVSSASTQIGESLYMNLEEFGDATGVAGNRTQFPFVDITKQVEKLLGSDYA